MKRTGNLYDEISDTRNLMLAFCKAKKSKEAKKEVVEFSKDVKANIRILHKELVRENVRVGDYHYFTIYDPKQRVICAASFRERILHHAIMNVCHPVFEEFQVFDSYATRPGKGQYAALERAKSFNKQNQWFCKLDIRKYFDSINHQILFEKLKQKIKDKRLLALFQRIIGSYHTLENHGIPIGNLTSQYFANYFLGFADHFIKEKLKVKAYVRYMDDMVIWSNDKVELLKVNEQFVEFLQKEIQLDVKSACIHQTKKGLPFLGYVLFQDFVRLNKNSKKRFLKKYKDYTTYHSGGFWSQKELSNHIMPLFAFVLHADSKELRQNMLAIQKEVC